MIIYLIHLIRVPINMQHKISSEQQMIELGKDIASKLKSGDIVLLYGDLGAGKTTLTKGIASYFGIDEVVSPTFTLLQVYKVPKVHTQGALVSPNKVKSLVHIDTYRLEHKEDLIEIGAEDYLGDKDTVCIIEWPEKIENLLADKKVIKIMIEHDGEEGRKIKIKD